MGGMGTVMALSSTGWVVIILVVVLVLVVIVAAAMKKPPLDEQPTGVVGGEGPEPEPRDDVLDVDEAYDEDDEEESMDDDEAETEEEEKVKEGTPVGG